MGSHGENFLWWWRLPADSHEVPCLLVSISFTASSYAIRVTDMVNMWEESLSRREIFRRAIREEASIDLGADPEQLGILLGKIESAFTPWHEEHELAALSLCRRQDGTQDDDMTLWVTCQLPNGMKPLQWPIFLKRMTQSHAAAALVLPLIQAQYNMSREVESLMAMATHKDAVIAKLLDKLEATGTGLDQVFNFPGKRKMTRSLAEERIKGLAPFEEGAWRKDLEPTHEGPKDIPTLLDAVFRKRGAHLKPIIDVDDLAGLDAWWTKLSVLSRVTIMSGKSKKKAETAAPVTPKEVKDDVDESEDMDDFQVQATPPHLTSARKRLAPEISKADDDASTADEDEIQIPDSNPLPSPPRASQITKKLPKLRSVGRAKPSAAARSPSPIPPAVDENDIDTASEEESDPVPTISTKPLPIPTADPPTEMIPRKGGLGRIGGKPKSSTRDLSPPMQGNAKSHSDTVTVPSPRKLGTIGKKAEPTAGGSDIEDPSRGRGRTAVKVEERAQPALRETSEERANRKRAELQQELEKKAAAGPSKKKRRF